MDITYLICVLVAVLLSVTFHEAMHAFTGYWLGDDTAKLHGRLSLNPLKHIDPFATVLLPLILAMLGAPPFGAAKPVPFNPERVKYGEYGAALIGVAGPLTNFVLSFIGFAILAFIPQTQLTGLFLQAFVLVNLGFFVFNILPIPPLDGSRVLYAIAPDAIRQLMAAMERYGILVIFAIVILFNSQLSVFMSAAVYGIIGFFARLLGVMVA